MKTVIYWFSGTGNSLAVAKSLAEQCGDTELVPIFQCLPALSGAEGDNPPPPADRIGLVFPVYSFGPPAQVVRFIKKMNAASDAYIFAVATYAGNMGGTLSTVCRLLQSRELDMAAGWGVKMPENYPPFGGAPALEKQQTVNEVAAEKIRQIAEELKQSPLGRCEQSGAVSRMLGKAVYPMFRRFLPRADKFFRSDANCNGCGICAKVCPANNITLKDGKPQWMGHCEQCFACFHWCPQKAVQYGRSEKQVRYHHPLTNLSDFTG